MYYNNALRTGRPGVGCVCRLLPFLRIDGFSVLCNHDEALESEGGGPYVAPGDEQDFPQPNSLSIAGTGSVMANPNMDEPGSSRTYPLQETSAKCCRRQHEVLLKYVRRTLQSLGHFEDLPALFLVDDTSRYKSSLPLQATRELKRVLTSARSLSEDCCCEIPH